MSAKGCSKYKTLMQKGLNFDYSMREREDIWHKELGSTFNIQLWNRMYSYVSKIKLDNRLKWFQYQVTRNSLFTNYKVNKFKQYVSPQCTFCGKNYEKISHLFFLCNHASSFWIQVQIWLGTLDIVFPQISHEILFGVSSSKNSVLINFITLCGKYFICKSKHEETNISIVNFKHFLHSKLKQLKDAFNYCGQIDAFNPFTNVYNSLANTS